MLNYLVFSAAMVLATTGILSAYHALRWRNPSSRVMIGCVAMFLSCAALVLAMRFLPHPPSKETRPWQDLGLALPLALPAFGIVFSVIMVSAGAFQGFKRWRYYRRNARQVPAESD